PVAAACGPAAGAPVDTRFTLAFTSAISGNAGSVAYASNLATSGMAFDSRGGTPRVTRKSTGVYQVKFPHLPLGAPFDGGTVKVTPLSTDRLGSIRFCPVERGGAKPRGTAVVAKVRCFDRTGAPSDMAISATFTQGINLLGDNPLDTAYLWADQPSSASYAPNAF